MTSYKIFRSRTALTQIYAILHCERFLSAYECTDIIEAQLGFIRLSFGSKILPADSILANSQIDDAFMCLKKSPGYDSVVFVGKVNFEIHRPMREATGLSPKRQNCYINGKYKIYVCRAFNQQETT